MTPTPTRFQREYKYNSARSRCTAFADVVAAEASYHAAYDYCTAQVLSQAGVATTFMRLEREGIQGNGHMLMLEMNHFEIAAAVQRWLARHAK